MNNSFDFATGEVFYLYAFKSRPRPDLFDKTDALTLLHKFGVCSDETGACFLLRPPKEFQGDPSNDGSRLEKRLLAALIFMSEDVFSLPEENLKEVRLAKDEVWALTPEKGRTQALEYAKILREGYCRAPRRPDEEKKETPLPAFLR